MREINECPGNNINNRYTKPYHMYHNNIIKKKHILTQLILYLDKTRKHNKLIKKHPAGLKSI